MKKYIIAIEPNALSDIQEVTDWYNKKQDGLGTRFQKTTLQLINNLDFYPQIYAIRYKEIRCMPVYKFPYMVHFYINDKNHTVEILAVISTDRNPKIWIEKTSR